MMTNPPREQSPRRLDDVIDQWRADDPAFDQRIRDNEPRAKLALEMLRLRRQAEVTQREMAVALGVDKAEVSRLESTVGTWPTAAQVTAYVGVCTDRACTSEEASQAELGRLLKMLPQI